MQEVVPGVIGEVTEFAATPEKKRRAPLVTKEEVSPSIKDKMALMPEAIRTVTRKESLLTKKENKSKQRRYLPVYDIPFPENTDPCRWLKEQGIVPVRRYQVAMVGFEGFQPLQLWAVDEYEAVFFFHTHYRVKFPESFRYECVESPTVKANASATQQAQTKPVASEPKKQ